MRRSMTATYPCSRNPQAHRQLAGTPNRSSAMAYPPEAERVAGAGLRDATDLGRLDDRDHRVAARCWMVSEEDQRLAIVRNLDRAFDDALRRQFLGDLPFEPDAGQAHPDAVAGRQHHVWRLRQRDPRRWCEP